MECVCIRLLDGEKVIASDYSKCLEELTHVCMLCNDSGLAYNEVGGVAVLKMGCKQV